jgi:hypothetical protein
MPTLSEKRTELIDHLGEQIEKLNNGADTYPVVRYVRDLMLAAPTMVRGPEDCQWKTTAKGLLAYCDNYLNEGSEAKTFLWALTQWSVYFCHALDAPATVPKPHAELDPNSETYRSM